MTLTIDASWVRGWVNWREYWMKAWMSPMVIAPDDTRRPPITAMATKFRLPRNIIAGWIVPEMNCAPKLASNSSSFLSANRFSTSRWRPNTLTSEWPVNASSTWAFSVPVWLHWATNRFFDRFAMKRSVKSDRGMVIERDQRQQRRDRDHHDQRRRRASAST